MLFYLTNLFSDFTYFSAMAFDTTMDDEEGVSHLRKVLETGRKDSKIPEAEMIVAGKAFLNYLAPKEGKELGSGAVGKHPLFSGISFVDPMRRNLEERFKIPE